MPRAKRAAAEIRSRLRLLSSREREVLDGLVAGKPNKIIAHDLGISPRTVEVYRANVMTKMQADSLSDLVRMALLGRATGPSRWRRAASFALDQVARRRSDGVRDAGCSNAGANLGLSSSSTTTPPSAARSSSPSRSKASASASMRGSEALLADLDLPRCGCLVVDYRMPVMDGLELIDALREPAMSRCRRS